jgi:hypothetical protein
MSPDVITVYVLTNYYVVMRMCYKYSNQTPPKFNGLIRCPSRRDTEAALAKSGRGRYACLGSYLTCFRSESQRKKRILTAFYDVFNLGLINSK